MEARAIILGSWGGWSTTTRKETVQLCARRLGTPGRQEQGEQGQAKVRQGQNRSEQG